MNFSKKILCKIRKFFIEKRLKQSYIAIMVEYIYTKGGIIHGF